MPHPKPYYMCFQLLLSILSEGKRLMGGDHGGFPILRGLCTFCFHAGPFVSPRMSKIRLPASLNDRLSQGSLSDLLSLLLCKDAWRLLDALSGLNTLSDSDFALGSSTGGLAENMYRCFVIFPTLCPTSWCRSLLGTRFVLGNLDLILCNCLLFA